MRKSNIISLAMDSSFGFSNNTRPKGIKSSIYTIDDYSSRSLLYSGSLDVKSSVNGGRLQRMLVELNRIERSIGNEIVMNKETSNYVKSGCRHLENLIVSLVEQYGYGEVPFHVADRLQKVIRKFEICIDCISSRKVPSDYKEKPNIEVNRNISENCLSMGSSFSMVNLNGAENRSIGNGSFLPMQADHNSSSEFEDELNT